jgi:hypothetical protein
MLDVPCGSTGMGLSMLEIRNWETTVRIDRASLDVFRWLASMRTQISLAEALHVAKRNVSEHNSCLED